MTITVKNFITDLARAIDDPNMVIIKALDWLEIINSNGSELSPEVMFEYSNDVLYSTVDTHTNEIDMSSSSTYPGLSSIKSVFLKDTSDKQFLYTNWTFDRNNQVLYLAPTDNSSYMDSITGSVRPSNTYATIIINWLGEMPDIVGTSSITMTKPRITLFRKICVREGSRRVLMDHMKLDRYRTLIGRANEYTLLAILRDMTAEIELDKSKLANSNTVKVF